MMYRYRTLATLALAVIAGGCSTTKMPPAKQEVTITGPSIIGYAPPVNKSELKATDPLAVAVDHLETAMAKCRTCFGGQGITVKTVSGMRVTIVDGERVLEVEPTRDSDGFGAVLIAPGKDPRIVRANPGPGSLIETVPAAASAYFSLPSCPAATQPAPR